MRNMKTLAALLMIAAVAVAYTAGVPTAEACKKCKKHNPTSAEDKHDHEHLDEKEGFTTILGKGHTEGWRL